MMPNSISQSPENLRSLPTQRSVENSSVPQAVEQQTPTIGVEDLEQMFLAEQPLSSEIMQEPSGEESPDDVSQEAVQIQGEGATPVAAVEEGNGESIPTGNPISATGPVQDEILDSVVELRKHPSPTDEPYVALAQRLMKG